MRVQVYVQKKEADQHFTLAADIDPAFFGLQETLQEVVAKATFHEWSQVAMKFVYPEAVNMQEPVKMEDIVRTGKDVDAMFAKTAEFVADAMGIPADSVQHMTPIPAQEVK